MKTPTCANCHNQWSWKITWKKFFTFNQALICPYCREKQYITKNARQKLPLLPIVIPFMNVPFLTFAVDGFYLAMIYVVCFIGIAIGMPYLYELSNEEEPLW